MNNIKNKPETKVIITGDLKPFFYNVQFTQDDWYNHLVEQECYWGTNDLLEMKDFCKRNQLFELFQFLNQL